MSIEGLWWEKNLVNEVETSVVELEQGENVMAQQVLVHLLLHLV